VEDWVDEPIGFREFVATRQRALLRTAWLLTGDWHAAEDLVQAALARTWPRWESIVRRDQPELYVRKVMLNTHATWWRRKWRGELPAEQVPDAAGADEFGAVDNRTAVRAALAALPARQRAAVVLRYFDDLTEAQAAEVLGCSVGTVKSQTSRALAKLRTSPLFQAEEATL
jgi:RNA polymerase sigma-70 factor (sigma-E family)